MFRKIQMESAESKALETDYRGCEAVNKVTDSQPFSIKKLVKYRMIFEGKYRKNFDIFLNLLLTLTLRNSL